MCAEYAFNRSPHRQSSRNICYSTRTRSRILNWFLVYLCGIYCYINELNGLWTHLDVLHRRVMRMHQSPMLDGINACGMTWSIGRVDLECPGCCQYCSHACAFVTIPGASCLECVAVTERRPRTDIDISRNPRSKHMLRVTVIHLAFSKPNQTLNWHLSIAEPPNRTKRT